MKLASSKPAQLLAGWLLLGALTGAQAHAHLEGSTPADGSVLATVPGELVLQFSESARLTALAIARDGGAAQPLRPLPQSSARRIVVALPALSPGDYVVSWRVLGADGHVVPGQVRFRLRP